MANNIQYTRIQARKFVPSGSRYYESDVIYYGEQKYITFPTYKKTDIKSSDQDKYTVINKSYEYRPDLVSADFYGTTIFWWKIMEANNIKDIYDFKSGISIYIPNSIF